jgi:putative peptide zinc metalloprotease protein
VRRESPSFRRRLFIRVRAVNPDRLFNALVGRVGFFFTRYFLAIAFATIFGAVVILLKSRSQLLTQMSELFALHYALGFWVAAILIVVLHEFAHGLTCKHFGGEVRELGFLLLYFNPALYCNVSDAWSFPERSKRLWVMFAGGFFEAFLWASAVVLWSVLPAGTLASRLCLMVITISGVKTLFNFNPLIKLDGYYLLSDYLEIPNLRSKAFGFLKNTLKTKLFKHQAAYRPLSLKERRVYWVYSVLASVYTIGLICLMFWKLGGFPVSRYHGTGVLILAGIATLVFGDMLLNTALRAYRSLLRRKMLPQYHI